MAEQTHTFLLEIGCEEIPHKMLPGLGEDLKRLAEECLGEGRIPGAEATTYHAPRRLALVLTGLPAKQDSRTEKVTGPPKRIAADADGNLTRAGLGFLKRHGLGPEAARFEETKKGEYLTATVTEEGLAMTDFLVREIPGVVARLPLPKAMRWGEGEHEFVRPVRWVVALLDDQVVPLAVMGTAAGNTSRGHRLIRKNGFVKIPNAQEYVDVLREQGSVLVDRGARWERIRGGLNQAELQHDAQAKSDVVGPLMSEVVELCEYPTVVSGAFDEKYLKLPMEVLTTSMIHHQKSFPVQRGEMLPKFMAVVDNLPEKAERIVPGLESVLAARLDDAAFFWDQDRQRSLEDRVPELKTVLFQRQLGSYHAKGSRLKAVAERARDLFPDVPADVNALARAAWLCKGDLVTDMVGEFPELQGVMGGLYAGSDGESDAVWKAIYEHYRPVGATDSGPDTTEGMLLSVLDKLDAVVGCFAVGIRPTGSSDPFALRRAAQGAMQVLLDNKIRCDVPAVLTALAGAYDVEGFDFAGARGEVCDFLVERWKYLGESSGYRYDEIAAVAETDVLTDPVMGEKKVKALSGFRTEARLPVLVQSAKRIRNILEQADKKEIAPAKFEAARLEAAAEKGLHEAAAAAAAKVQAAAEEGDYATALTALAELADPLETFFARETGVMVMVEDPALRDNRLALLRQIQETFRRVADFSQIVLEGEAA